MASHKYKVGQNVWWSKGKPQMVITSRQRHAAAMGIACASFAIAGLVWPLLDLAYYKVPNRFELVLLGVHRAREITKGSHITIEAENDKNPVLALREIAEKTIAPGDMRKGLIHSIQRNVEVDGAN